MESSAPSLLSASDVRRIGLDGLPVPHFRGRLHQFGVIPVAGVGMWLTLTTQGVVNRFAVAVYAITMVTMLSASAFYHCHARTPSAKVWARRADHSAIFGAIVGTHTAYWVLAVPRPVALPVVVVLWGVAAFGITHKMRTITHTTTTGSWLYSALGWTAVALLPWIVPALGWVGMSLVVGGGLAYTMGGIILIKKRPNPWPDVFGYHEVWHMFVLVGVICHGAATFLIR